MDVRKVPSPVKRVVHLGSRSYGRLTAPGRMTPSFLICGGQRCGTTSLYRALAAHPVVLKAVLHKGVHYFDTSYQRGMGWYRGHFPLQRTRERITERYGSPAQTFESSPYYMYHPQAAARIAPRPARREAGRAGPRPGGAGLLAARARGRPRLRAGTRLRAARWRWNRPGCTARRRRLAARPATTTASPTSTTRTGPAASTPATCSAVGAHVGRDRIHVVESERFFAEPEAGLRRGAALPRAARTWGARRSSSTTPGPAYVRHGPAGTRAT